MTFLKEVFVLNVQKLQEVIFISITFNKLLLLSIERIFTFHSIFLFKLLSFLSYH